MLRRLEERYPTWKRLAWQNVAIHLGLPPVWQKAVPDAVWKTECGETIVAEAYSRIGQLTAGHRRKLAMDALKLLGLRHAISSNQSARYLLVVPDELAHSLRGDGWFPAALSMAAELVSVALTSEEREKLHRASARQAQGQARVTRSPGGRMT
jgi:hypothetical protein